MNTKNMIYSLPQLDPWAPQSRRSQPEVSTALPSAAVMQQSYLPGEAQNLDMT